MVDSENSDDSDYVYESAPDSGSADEACDDVGDEVAEWELSALDEVSEEGTINEKMEKVVELCSCSACGEPASRQKLSLFLQNLENMDKEQRRLCLMTSLAMLRTTCSTKAMRKRFTYVLPVAGTVCRDVYAAAFGFSVRTLTLSCEGLLT
jgi:hypothetical protein